MKFFTTVIHSYFITAISYYLGFLTEPNEITFCGFLCSRTLGVQLTGLPLFYFYVQLLKIGAGRNIERFLIG